VSIANFEPSSPGDREGIVGSLRAGIDAAMSGLLDVGAPFALLGAPELADLGGSATYLGELQSLQQHHGVPGHVGAVGPSNWLRMEKRIGDGPILLHGGGLDQAWPNAQAFREAVLWRYRGRRVIQLPQALHFPSQAAIDQAARVIERHGAFTLLVRDQPSYDLARRSFHCEVRMCPDPAFALGLLPRGVPSRPMLLLLRDEGERQAGQREVQTGNVAAIPDRADGTDAVPFTWGERRRMMGAMVRSLSRDRLLTIWRARAEVQLARGLALLRTAECVITDRYDAHVLCLLTGIPHYVVDDGGGEVAATIATWNTDRACLGRVANLPEALTSYERRRAEPGLPTAR
jgi:exopolysaccharide biosynthesis predicted pyruvyltransferase EpsI